MLLRPFSPAAVCSLRTIGLFALIAGFLAAAIGAARCQDQSAATPGDTIFARKTVWIRSTII